MYSPQKANSSKLADREKVKEAKKQQLAILLINKFRNKFNVVSATESKIDQHIVSEVQKLLRDKDQASQNGLKTLDVKLSEDIKKMREEPNMKSEAAASTKGNILSQLEARNQDQSKVGSQRSIRSCMSQNTGLKIMNSSKSSNFVKPKSPQLFDGIVLHEDPAEKLCIDEKQWNSIVQENLKKFENEKLKAKQDKLMKAQTIQLEQMKQVEEKMQKIKEMKKLDQEHFNQFGKDASNKYYLNQDKKDQQKKMMKGGSREVAENLRLKQDEKYKLRVEQMKQAADKRQEELNEFNELQTQKKQELVNKKYKLRQQQDQDAQAKRDFKDRDSKMLKRVEDFTDNNILTYVYQKKENKSVEYDKHKEANIKKILQNFPLENKIEKYHQDLTEREKNKTGYNATDGPSVEQQAERKAQRKQKELEAKQFQDIQIQEKNEQKQARRAEVVAEMERVKKDVEYFKQEEQQKKIDRIVKNKNHLDLVKLQIDEPPRMFAKTGVAVIKNSGQPKLPV